MLNISIYRSGITSAGTVILGLEIISADAVSKNNSFIRAGIRVISIKVQNPIVGADVIITIITIAVVVVVVIINLLILTKIQRLVVIVLNGQRSMIKRDENNS